MRFQVPIGRADSLPDPVEVRMARNRRRTIPRLRLGGAGSEPKGCYCHDCVDESIVQSIIPLICQSPSDLLNCRMLAETLIMAIWIEARAPTMVYDACGMRF